MGHRAARPLVPNGYISKGKSDTESSPGSRRKEDPKKKEPGILEEIITPGTPLNIAINPFEMWD